MSKDLTMAEMLEEIEKAERLIVAHTDTKNYWIAKVNADIVLANKVIAGGHVDWTVI